MQRSCAHRAALAAVPLALLAACIPQPEPPQANIRPPAGIPGSSFTAFEPGLRIEAAARLAPDAIYILGSGKSEYGYHTEDHWLARTTPAGDILWRRPLDTTTATHMAAFGPHRLALIGAAHTGIDDREERRAHPAFARDEASGQRARRDLFQFTAASSASDIELIDTEGNRIWREDVLPGRDVNLLALAASSNAIIAGGWLIAKDGRRSDALLVRYDNAGKQVWQRTLIGPGPSPAPTSHWVSALALLPDGRILAAGGSVFGAGEVFKGETYAGSGIGWLALLDAEGQPLWTRWLDDAPSNPPSRRPDRDPPANWDSLTVRDLSIAVHEDAIYVGRTARSYSTHILYRFAFDGQRVWAKTLAAKVEPGNDSLSRIFRPLALAADGGGVFIAGTGDNRSGEYAALMHVTPGGEISWKQLYGWSRERHTLRTLMRDGDHLLAYGGRVCSTWCAGPHARGWILRTDLSGALSAPEVDDLLASRKAATRPTTPAIRQKPQ